MADFFGPGNEMQPACEGWKKADYHFYKADVSFNNCHLNPAQYAEYRVVTESTVFYDFAAGPITDPPACLLKTVENKNDVALLKIYPNPVADKITVHSDLPFSSYEILDSSGKVGKMGDVLRKTVEVGALTKGIYYLKLTSKNGGSFYLAFCKKLILTNNAKYIRS